MLFLCGGRDLFQRFAATEGDEGVVLAFARHIGAIHKFIALGFGIFDLGFGAREVVTAKLKSFAATAVIGFFVQNGRAHIFGTAASCCWNHANCAEQSWA